MNKAREEISVWSSPREKDFVVGYMARQGWIFESSVPDGPDSHKMTFYKPPPPPPPVHEEAIFETACGCRRIVKLPAGTPTVCVPILKSSRVSWIEPSPSDGLENPVREFERTGKRDEFGRPIYAEVLR